MKRNWFDTKVLILGYSKSGISAAKYLSEKGANCFISEFKTQDEKDISGLEELKKLGIEVEFGKHSDEFLQDAYLAITSPGVPPHAPVFNRLKEKKIPVISEIELAYLETGAPFVAITGTNGKTTTTSLTSTILSKKYKAPACGNIGHPPTSLLNEKIDYFVCELSSYQIEFSPSFRAQIAMFLNFTPDHINWHGGLQNYFDAKAKIFTPPQAPAFAIFNATDENLFEFSKTCPSEVWHFGKNTGKNCCWVKDEAIWFKRDKEEKIIDIKDIPIVGEHNLQNVEAAVIAAKIVGIENEKIKSAIMEFKAIEHRCEFVKNIDGIDFYNDSKATNPEAAIVAIKSFCSKKVTLIAGGRDKMTDLSEFCETVKSCISDVILIGEAAERFEQALLSVNYNNIQKINSLEEAIDLAVKKNNEIVLLSPACASFDMFENYEKRGEVFKEYVSSKV